MHVPPVTASDSPATNTFPARHDIAAARRAAPTRPVWCRWAALVGAVSASSILLGAVLMLFGAATAAAPQVDARAAAPLWQCTDA